MRKYYYHITQKRWKSLIKLNPKSIGTNRTEYESDLPRTCVSPTIEQCLVALGECLSIDSVIYVFRTKNKIKPLPAVGIPDSILTNEHWVTRQCSFIKIGRINPVILPRDLFVLPSGQKEDIKAQRKMHNSLLKLNVSRFLY